MAKPKNPVRAARQAGREQIRAAKQQIKSYKDNKKVEAKLAKVDSRISKKLDKIEKKLPPSQTMVGKDAGRVTGEAKPIGFKSVADKYKLQAPAPKSAPKSGGSKGGTSKKSSGSTDVKTTKKDLPNIKLSEYAELQKQYDEKKSKESRTQADIAEQKRIARIKADSAFANAKEKARVEAQYQNWLKSQGKLPSMYSKDALDKMRKKKDELDAAKRKENIEKMKPSFYMKKKGGSVKKYQAGGAYTTVKATKPGPKSSGPAPVNKPVAKRSAWDTAKSIIPSNRPSNKPSGSAPTAKGVRPASKQQTVKSKK
jgi:hypothetical protein